MIVEKFDRQAMARMEVALDRACEHFAYGGKHNVRKRVAQSIIRRAKMKNADLDALEEEPTPWHKVLGPTGRAQHSKLS